MRAAVNFRQKTQNAKTAFKVSCIWAIERHMTYY